MSLVKDVSEKIEIYEKGITVDDGGDIKEFINKIRGKSFKCWCQKVPKIDTFAGYPHDDGIADGNGKKWWVYWTCPNCQYDWSWTKLERRFDDGMLILG